MTMWYVHPAEEPKREAVNKLENFRMTEAVKLAEKRQQVPTISTTSATIQCTLLLTHWKIWSGRGDLNSRPPAPKD
jgi:hypothetical protein